MTFAKIVLIPTAVIVAGMFASIALGVCLNVTPSVPTGLYLQSAPPPIPARGSLVVACLAPSNPATAQALARGYLPDGDCPGAVAPVLKPVAGLPGDHVATTMAGIVVNGTLLPGTAQRLRDPQGRPLAAPPAEYRVPAGTVLLLVSRASSFDGRYFGPVPIANIRAQASPLVLF